MKNSNSFNININEIFVISSNVKLQTYTWQKDSHGLFDYESKQHFKGEFLIDETSRIYRHENELHMITGEIDHKDLNKSNLSYLFHIEQLQNNQNG